MWVKSDFFGCGKNVGGMGFFGCGKNEGEMVFFCCGILVGGWCVGDDAYCTLVDDAEGG